MPMAAGLASMSYTYLHIRQDNAGVWGYERAAVTAPEGQPADDSKNTVIESMPNEDL